MKTFVTFLKSVAIVSCLFLGTVASHAALSVKMDAPKTIGSKSIIKLTMKNTFKQRIESARAEVFLTDEKGKMVGQAARWVIGGTKDKTSLAPDSETTFNFVIESDKPFKDVKVSFSRIILEGGKMGDPIKDVEIVTNGK